MPSRKQRRKSAPSILSAIPTPVGAAPAATRMRGGAALVTVVLALGIVQGVKFFFVPLEPRPLNRALATLPYELAGWKGEDPSDEQAAQIDEQFGYLEADDAITRDYISPTGQRVSIHIAAWVRQDEWAPHPPEACYALSGWDVKPGESLALGAESQRAQQFKATELGGEIEVLYWYRLGDTYFKDRDGARAARQALWGSSEWPPLFKVIVQSTGISLEDPQSGMKEIARELDAFTREL